MTLSIAIVALFLGLLGIGLLARTKEPTDCCGSGRCGLYRSTVVVRKK